MSDAAEKLKKSAFEYIDGISEDIYRIGDYLMSVPELGYMEEKTSEYIRGILNDVCDEMSDHLALTGVKGKIYGKSHDINVCVMGELDAVICPAHPMADSITGAAHACGHNIQLANLAACAMALRNSGIMSELCGDVSLLAVPAEEFIDIAARKRLKKEGKIKYLDGKCEMLDKGIFKDIDIAMMVHSQAGCEEQAVFVSGSGLGFVAKSIRFVGKAAHAGGAPHEGINALNAANGAMMLINSLRETFRDEDKIRVHSIITKGGDSVNTVPDDVRMEMYVRGATPQAIEEAAYKVDRAIKGAAYGLGATVEIEDEGFYAPLVQNTALSRLFEENAERFTDKIYHGIDMIGSTDVGNVSEIIPTMQPTMGGYLGGAHSKEFIASDKYFTHIVPAKIMVGTIIDLLYNGAETAGKIKEEFICGQKTN